MKYTRQGGKRMWLYVQWYNYCTTLTKPYRIWSKYFFELIVNCDLFSCMASHYWFRASRHVLRIINKMLPRVFFMLLLLFCFACALRFIYYHHCHHHQDEHAVPTAFKYVKFLFCMSIRISICPTHSFASVFPVYFFFRCLFSSLRLYIFFSLSLIIILYILCFIYIFILNSLQLKVLCHFCRCSVAYVILKANSVIVWWNEKRKRHKSTNKRKSL